jgi:hypothetical protein
VWGQVHAQTHDTSFNPDLRLIAEEFGVMALQPDGKIIIAIEHARVGHRQGPSHNKQNAKHQLGVLLYAYQKIITSARPLMPVRKQGLNISRLCTDWLPFYVCRNTAQLWAP